MRVGGLPPSLRRHVFAIRLKLIAPLATPLVYDNLLPAEVFLLSRLDRPMPLRDLVAISGVGEEETLALVYSLALDRSAETRTLEEFIS